jgi:hypothetical protein
MTKIATKTKKKSKRTTDTNHNTTQKETRHVQ